MKQLDEFLNQLGIDEQAKSQLLSADVPEGFDVSSVANKVKSNIGAVYVAQTGLEFKKEDVDKQFDVYKKVEAANLNKDFGLGLSRDEAESIPPAEMRKKIKAHYDKLVKDAEKAAGVDPIKQEMITNLTTERDTFKSNYEQLVETRDAEIAKIKGESMQQVKQALAGLAYTTEWSKRKVPAHMAASEEIFRKQFEQTILSTYDSDEFGNITAKGGDGQAINFEKNGVWKHISEPLDYLWKKYGLEAVANGQGSGGKGIVAGGTDQTKLSPRVIEMQRKAQEAANRR